MVHRFGTVVAEVNHHCTGVGVAVVPPQGFVSVLLVVQCGVGVVCVGVDDEGWGWVQYD